MPYKKIAEIPKVLKSAGLTLVQANFWAELYDKFKKQKNIKSPAALAWKVFKQKYYQSGKIWKLKKISKGEKMSKTNSIKGYELVYRESPLISALENVDAEGKFYEKELIREGSWAHPQKQNIRFKVTTKRMQTWVDNFNKKLFKVPVPKRHSLDPEDNRGWVTGLSIRKNKKNINVLYGKLDITNSGMQKKINNGDIQDVSVSIGSYADNQGKNHGEVLRHVALTVIPHIDKQAGFKSINAEGYLNLEEDNYIKKVKNGESLEEYNLAAVYGSKEKEIDDLRLALIDYTSFSGLYIEATFSDKVIFYAYEKDIVKYYEVSYTKDLDGKYIFGDKKEMVKEFYFIEKTNLENKEVKKETEKNIKEVNKVDELEKLQLENQGISEKIVLLEKEVEISKVKVADFEKKVSELEAGNIAKDEELKKYADEKAANLEKAVDEKVDTLIKNGNITPALKDNVKKALLEGGIVAEMLEKSLKNQEKFSLEEKTIQESKEVKKKDKVDAELEAERIKKGE
jgi:hypothetical protein